MNHRGEPQLHRAQVPLSRLMEAGAAASRDEGRFVATLLLVRRAGLRPFMTSGQRRSAIDWGISPPKVTPDDLAEPDGHRFR